MTPVTSAVNIIRYIAQHPLSRGRRFRNISRFVAWQLRSAALPHTTFKFVNNTRVHLRRGMTGITGNLYVGLDEFQDMALLLHLLRPGDLFVDVGANVGAYTILAAAAIGADVIAFEPGQPARDWLNRNIELNGCRHRVDSRHQAIGSFCGTMAFTMGLNTVNHLVPNRSSHEVEDEFEEVEITTLDEALEGKSPIMLKVDVEGFETEVVRGAPTTLANPELRCVLLELGGTGSSFGYNEDDVRRRMKEVGFTPCNYLPFERRLVPSDTFAYNNIFIRDIAYVAERLATAKAFRVLGKSI